MASFRWLRQPPDYIVVGLMRHQHPMAERLMLSLLLFFAASLPAQDTAAADDGEIPILRPDTAQLLPEQRQIVRDSEGYFDRYRETLTPEQLGAAFGRLGMAYQALRTQAAAVAAYKNAILHAPGDPGWPFYLAVEYEEMGEWMRAIGQYENSLRLHPDNPYVWLRLGEVALEAGQLANARNAFIEATTLQPDFAAPIGGLGKVAMRQQEYSLAIQYFTNALRRQPEANLLHYRIAQAYRHQGNVAAAEEHLKQRGEQDLTATDPLISLLERFSRSSAYYVSEGVRAASDGNQALATNLFKLAVTVNPGDVEAYTRLALSLRIQQKQDQAREVLETALELEPDHALANTLMGSRLEELGESSEAIVHYRRAIAADPGDIRSRFMLANGLMRQGDFSEAGTLYAEIAARQPDNARAHFMVGLTYLATDNCGPSLAPLRRALSLSPRTREAAVALTRAYSYCPDATDVQREQALTTAERLYQSGPSMEHSATIAMAKAANGRFEEAVDYQALAIFEAAKTGRTDAQTELRANMQRYQEEKPAARAFAPGDPIFDPGFIIEDTPPPKAED